MASSILQWNIRGIKPNYTELNLLIKERSPNVICIQETKLPSEDFVIKGYQEFHHIHKDGLIACGGTSIFVKNSVIHSKIPLNTKLQAVAVRVTLHKTLTICSIYIPPDSNPSPKDFENLKNQLPTPFILVGDFNAHNPMWGSSSTNQRGKTMEDFLMKTNICLFNDSSPTHVNSQNLETSCIDLSLCDPDLYSDFTWSVHDDLNGSDHYPILIVPQIPQKQSQNSNKFNFKRANWSSFSDDCKTLLNNQCNIDTYDQFYDVLTSIADERIPKLSSKPRKNKSWFSEECRKAIANKKKAFRKFAKTKSDEDLKLYKIARALCRKVLRESKRTSFRNYVSKINSQTPLTKVWKMVKKLRGTDDSCSIGHIDLPDGSRAESEKDISNAIADTLTENSSSNNYKKQFQKHKAQEEKIKLDFSSSENENYNEPFTISELKLCINDLSNTAPGPDGIHNQIIQRLPDETLHVLLKIYNDIWSTQTFPESWRNATIIPIPKPNKDHSNPSNYRPIALTSCLCKLMEKLVNKRLMWYLESEKCLSDLQCGFRKNRSTVDHLVRLEFFIREAFAKGEHLVAVFFDLEKAFDTTWKHGILKDLHNMGLKGNIAILIQNFLSNRAFQVKVGSSLSDPHCQEEGVPQGSILSPILFEIKMNSIVQSLRSNMDSSLYVDDFLICYKTKAGVEVAERQLQLQLKKLEEWGNLNGFKFSPTKTSAVHFCHRRNCIRQPDLFLYDTRIPVKDEARFLGLIFDSKLSFLPHIRDLKKRCQKALNAFKVLCNKEWGGTSDILLNLYRSLIRSKLDYGCFVYGSARPTYLGMLDPIQHQGLRLALGAFRTSPVKSLRAEANEPCLSLRREQLGTQYALKIKSVKDNPAYDCIFNIDMSTIDTFTNKQKPFALRVREDLLLEDLLEENVTEFSFPSEPPWRLKPPQVDLSMTKNHKADTTSKTYKKMLNNIIQKYPNRKHIFTDGSKDFGCVGAAAYSTAASSQERLNGCASIFSAEASALSLALKIVKNCDEKSFLIFSDSLSCLKALKSFKISDMRILCLIEELNSLLPDKDIVFVWVPSHVGIEGNDQADSLAKEASCFDPSQATAPIPFSDFKAVVKKGIWNEMKNYWSIQTNKIKQSHA